MYLLKTEQLARLSVRLPRSESANSIRVRSGIWHEIDVLAELPTKSVRTACECKNRDTSSSDIYVFAEKLRDLGIPQGVIVTTSAQVQPDVFLAAKMNGITVCYSASLLSKIE